MTVNIAAGWGSIVATTANLGVYGVYNDATVIQSISAADATNPRIDLIVATVNDAQYSGSLNNVVFTTVAGTPAASPAVPSTPNNSIVLAQIAVAANATSISNANITDRRVPVQNGLLNANYYTSTANSATIATPALTNNAAWTGSNFAIAANTTYEVSGVLHFQFVAGTNTAANFALNLSSAALSSKLKIDSAYGASITSANASFSAAVTVGTTTNVTSTTTNGVTQTVVVSVNGLIRCSSTSGTLTPVVGFGSLTGVSNLIGLANSYLKITPIAGSNFTNLGAWS
jgi:hypothetical protein